jgi:redox-sensitive bicupin YhaK (pirin superfamily)
MEIVSYVLEGALQHKDSMGTGSIIRPGDVQRMSAGTGVLHSEFNASRDELVHFLQIWIVPDRPGHAPGYEQKAFSAEEKRGRLRLIASADGHDGSVTLHQDVNLFAGLLTPGDRVTFETKPGRHTWVQVARGSIAIEGEVLDAGDGASIEQVKTVAVSAREREGDPEAEILVFDLA